VLGRLGGVKLAKEGRALAWHKAGTWSLSLLPRVAWIRCGSC